MSGGRFFADHPASIIKQEEEVCYLDHGNSCTPASNPVTPRPNLRAVLLLLPLLWLRLLPSLPRLGTAAIVAET